MPVARAYLEHHVVLAELLHELLAVAHVPAQICEDGWGKRSARGSRVDRRDGSRLLSPGVPFCRAWKSFASIASLSWMVFRADIVARVPLHACDAREVSGDRAGLPRAKAWARVSAAVIQIFRSSNKRKFLPRLTHASRGLNSRARARGGHVLLRRPALAQGRAGSDMGTPRPDDAPRARAARAFPPLLVRSRSRPSFDRTRLTSPPRRAFADPGAPAEPRGSPESGQVRQALRGERVQHHHEAALSAGTSSPARRKTSLRYDP